MSTQTRMLHIGCFIRAKRQSRVFSRAQKAVRVADEKLRCAFMPFYATTLSLFFYEKDYRRIDAQLRNAPDQSDRRARRFSLWRVRAAVIYLYWVDAESLVSAKIKTSDLTSRKTGCGVCKRFRRTITRNARREWKFLSRYREMLIF